jgi:hypothetical protein
MVEPAASTEIYMPLLDEGVDVWRPVRAQHVSDDVYRITGEAPDAEDERWQFPPGALVRCRDQMLSGGTCVVAYEAVSERGSRDATPTI